MSSDPTIAIMSAISDSRRHVAVASSATNDGAVTFRTIECAGGCGYAPVVVVDGRYREPVAPEGVSALVEEIRAEA